MNIIKSVTIINYKIGGIFMLSNFSEKAQKVIAIAESIAFDFGHNYIGTEHLLLGLIREGEGVAARVLENLGVDLNKIRSNVVKMLGDSKPTAGAGVPINFSTILS